MWEYPDQQSEVCMLYVFIAHVFAVIRFYFSFGSCLLRIIYFT